MDTASVLDGEPVPTSQADSSSLYWTHEKLHRAVLLNYPERIKTYAADRDAMEKLPQTLINVRVRDKSVADAEILREAVRNESAALEGVGRVLLRPSGTEPLVRVMVEAPTAERADAVCARLVAVLRAAS